MTAIAHVRRARAALVATATGASLLWGAAACGALVLVVALVDLAIALPFDARRLVRPGAILAAVIAAGVVLWHGRHALRLGRVALYLEERVPALRYSLVSALQPAGHPAAGALEALERHVAGAGLNGALRAPVARGLGLPAGALAATLLMLALLPDGSLERMLHPRPGDILRRSVLRAALGSRLSPMVARIEPPRYARQSARTIEEPGAVAALVGSRITLTGRGAAEGATDSLGAVIGVGTDGVRSNLALAIDGDEWSVPIVMPARPTAVRLADRRYDRLLVLDPVPDEPPAVGLTAPVHDSVFMLPKGRIALVATLQDDIGLGRAEFEVMHTSASGSDTYKSVRSTVGAARLGGARTASLRATIMLDTMRLKPGDVVHLRAVAWDENDVTGPGRGESDTRMIRILDPRDRDRLAISPAKAAAIDTSIISQRMLNMRAESLLVLRRRLDPEQFTRQSLNLSLRQGELRGRVESIVYELENVQGVGFVGETPNSRILRQAAGKMQEAGTELAIAQVDAALPYMREALKLLERARDANRYWLRGVLTSKPIEVEKLRMTGRSRYEAGGRDPRERAREPRKALLERLDRAVPLLYRDRAAGRDSLLLLRVTALNMARDVAEPLGEALEELQAGRDARLPLLRARRRLERASASDDALSGWQGAP